MPLLRLVESVEQGPLCDTHDRLEACHVSLDTFNQAILATLRVVEV